MKALRLKNLGLKQYNWGKLGLELLVVFLGVSSGFLLNNWQERQQEKQLEQKYISGFLQDVGGNIQQLEELIASDSIWLNQSLRNVLMIKGDSLSLDTAEAMVKKIVVINKIELYEGTYQDITNSGNLNIIQNFELRSGIVEYQLAINGVHFVDDYFYKYFNDYVMPFVLSNFNVLTGHFKADDSYRTLEFSNAFVGFYSMVQQRRQAYSGLLEKSNTFQEMLLKAQNKEHLDLDDPLDDH